MLCLTWWKVWMHKTCPLQKFASYRVPHKRAGSLEETFLHFFVFLTRQKVRKLFFWIFRDFILNKGRIINKWIGTWYCDLFSEFWSSESLGVIVLIYDFQAYFWSSKVSRISGKMKKANKCREGQTKARESTIPQFYNLFISTWPLGILYS